MPELPDVEVMRRVIAPGVRGRTVSGVTLNWPNAVKAPTAGEFQEGLMGATVEDVGRRAKYFLFQLRDTRTLIVHLRMTGSLRVVESQGEMHRYTQTVFHFEDGYDMRFVDPRKFGAVWLVDEAESVVGDLGPEPLEPAFTAEVLGGILEGRGTAIKSLLMDQKRIAGIGNIYADDILFRSGVHPMTRARDLELDKVESIHESIVWVLSRAIDILEKNMPVDAPPTEDLGPMIFLAPREKGAGCPRCSGEIDKMVVGGRGTYFCGRCQSGVG